MSSLPISEADLHAYVDDRLPAARRGEIDTYLANDAEAAERLQAYRGQRDALRELFAPLLAEPLPATLRRLAEPPVATGEAPPGSWLPGWSVQRIAAGLLIALLGGLAGWFGHVQYQPGERLAAAIPLARQAAVAHAVYSPDLRRPVEIAADQEELLVKWLSKRLGSPVRPPKLAGLGYELIGGRLLPGNAGPVAQFMYQESSGQRLTLYVSTERQVNGDTGFRFAREGLVNVFYWIDGEFSYALSASIAKGELAKVATAVYDQLEPK
ncbi:anti-sigma factor family protein [Dechloromonas denitrificans]|uniref:anti-sigma factor family protein n=1 Tax=Dechloromonas denitrificans TaxID=281362 RepID=UPI001CFB3EA7|nr:anti-sigma factor [Dechloromonas denitrificans]UCV08615.1 anti-sigma factor [Dechloromonas denitrificans]